MASSYYKVVLRKLLYMILQRRSNDQEYIKILESRSVLRSGPTNIFSGWLVVEILESKIAGSIFLLFTLLLIGP